MHMRKVETYLRKITENKGLTDFQKKVLIACMEIPSGDVRTYAWIAARIGSPGASRAVGGALSRNPYAPHVPCHRVIASDGSTGGYSGGIERKKELLRSEKENKRGPCDL